MKCYTFDFYEMLIEYCSEFLLRDSFEISIFTLFTQVSSELKLFVNKLWSIIRANQLSNLFVHLIDSFFNLIFFRGKFIL